jgi:hypothetical protein
MLFPVTADTIGTLFNLLFIPFPAEIWKQAIRIVFENQLKHGIGRPPSNRSWFRWKVSVRRLLRVMPHNILAFIRRAEHGV